MYINIWSSPLLAGISRGWCTWFDAMARTQDLSAPWRTEARSDSRRHGTMPRHLPIGPHQSASEAK